MSRFSNPFIQYISGSSNVEAGSKLNFYETGTTTRKDTFFKSDLLPANANPNPVIANADGFFGDIWLDGIYNVVLTDKDDVTIDDADPVGDTTEGQWELWLNDNTYNKPNIVLASDDNYYRSLVDGNQGNDPTSSAANWEQLELGRIWNINVTYSRGNSVYDSNGFLKKSEIDSNLANNPATDNTNWSSGTLIPRTYLSGFGTAPDTVGGDTDHDITISVGDCDDSTQLNLIKLSTALTKQIDADWVEGDNAGGFPSVLTLTADTTYHLFVIAKPDGTTDAGWDTSLLATNLLADATGYSLFRRVACNLTDSLINIEFYTQTVDRFIFGTPASDATNVTVGTTEVPLTLSTPLGVVVTAIVQPSLQTGATALTRVYSTFDTNVTVVSGNETLGSSSSNNRPVVIKEILTNTSSEIVWRQSTSTNGNYLQTLGWIDRRGKE